MSTVTRDTVLDLAERAGDERNWPLRELLLAAAGMLEADGTATRLPDEMDRWHRVVALSGPYGVGLALLERRREKQAVAR
jgi:hypothetical protein